MKKWDYIKFISINGDRFGNQGGLNDLLVWCGKYGTASVTEDEARRYFEMTVWSKKEKDFSNAREALSANG